MFELTKMKNQVQKIFFHRKFLYLYDNSTYRTTFDVLSSWRKHVSLTSDQQNFNKRMSKIWVLWLHDWLNWLLTFKRITNTNFDRTKLRIDTKDVILLRFWLSMSILEVRDWGWISKMSANTKNATMREKFNILISLNL